MQRRLIEQLVRLRNIQRRVLRKEPIRLKHNANLFHRHNGEILNTRVMRKSKRMPQHNIFILNRVLPLNHLLNTMRLLALVGELTSREKFSVAVSSDPDRLRGEYSTLQTEGVLACQHHLCG